MTERRRGKSGAQTCAPPVGKDNDQEANMTAATMESFQNTPKRGWTVASGREPIPLTGAIARHQNP